MFADMKQMVEKAWREQYALLAINRMNLRAPAPRYAWRKNTARRLFSISIRAIWRIFRQRQRWRWSGPLPKRPAFP